MLLTSGLMTCVSIAAASSSRCVVLVQNPTATELLVSEIRAGAGSSIVCLEIQVDSCFAILSLVSSYPRLQDKSLRREKAVRCSRDLA